MTLTIQQQKKVEENMGLVGQVIKDKVHGINQMGFFTYDDLFQTGCIGLCKAVATDNGKCEFSTYAYRLIWNAICDRLIYATRRKNKEELSEDTGAIFTGKTQDDIELKITLQAALDKARETANPTVKKGIDALILMSEGFSAKEIGESFDAAANLVTAWVSKARKFLREREDLQELAASGLSL